MTTMNNSERAEKIWDDLENRRMGVRIKGIWVMRLTQELDEAVRDAFEAGRKEGWQIPEGIRMAGFNKGFAVAREQAARIPMEHMNSCEDERLERYSWHTYSQAIARRIRAMTPNVPGETKK